MEKTKERNAGCALLNRGMGGYHSFVISTIAAGQVLDAGSVLGWHTASKKFKQLTPGASDGTQNARAVLYANVDASEGDVVAVVIDLSCELKGAELVWPEGINPTQKANALDQLTGLGLIVR